MNRRQWQHDKNKPHNKRPSHAITLAASNVSKNISSEKRFSLSTILVRCAQIFQFIYAHKNVFRNIKCLGLLCVCTSLYYYREGTTLPTIYFVHPANIKQQQRCIAGNAKLFYRALSGTRKIYETIFCALCE